MSYVVTLIAARAATTLDRATIDLVRDIVKGREIATLSAEEAVDITCAAQPDVETIRAALGTAAIDVAVSAAEGRRKSVLVADMDSTIVQSETLDDMAALAGLGEQVAAVTRRSMNGEVDFAESLRLRVALLRGKERTLLEQAWRHVVLMGGARTLVQTMRTNGARTALVSGGFTWFTARVAELCGFDEHHANILLFDGDHFAGAVEEPILDRNAKLIQLTRLCAERDVSLKDGLAVGDGANDLDMIRAAGMGVGYHGKAVVKASARYRVDHADLEALLFMQGYSRAHFASA